jgi:hypothetical protein
VNVDAAMFPHQCHMAVGAVFVDQMGQCSLAVSEPLQGSTPLEMTEALALRCTMTISSDHGYDRVTFVFDCLSLIQGFFYLQDLIGLRWVTWSSISCFWQRASPRPPSDKLDVL